MLIIAFVGGVFLCIGLIALALSCRGGKQNNKKEPNFPSQDNELEERQENGSDRDIGIGFETIPAPLEDPLIPDSVRRFETDTTKRVPDDADEELIVTRDDVLRMKNRYPNPKTEYTPPTTDLSNLPI